MKILIDANILYPTIMREVLLGVADAGLFTPLWSPRILEEWSRAAKRLSPEAEQQARSEIALLQASWPQSSVRYAPELENRLWLPDPADVHVLAAAIAGSADAIMTMNAKDFPRHILAEEGLVRMDPDSYLFGCYTATPEPVGSVADTVLKNAIRLSGETWTIRKLMKKARLPRFGKALERSA